MTEQFANNAQSTLNGAINSSTTSIIVTSGSPFSSTGNFRIIIDSEIIKVTSRSGNTLTVVRGQEGTSASSHLDLSIVTQIITSAGLIQGIQDIVIPTTTVLLDNVSGNGSYPSTPVTNWTGSFTPSRTGNVLILAAASGYVTSANNVISLNLVIDGSIVKSSSIYLDIAVTHSAIPSIFYYGSLSITSHTIALTHSGTTAIGDSGDYAQLTILEY